MQHLVTCALGGGFVPAELLAELRGTHAYAELSDAQWQWALDFVVHGGASLNAYPEYRRVVIGDDGIARVPDAAIARRHRASIGTIVSEASITVQFRNGHRLGHVEESFIARLGRGDCFVFAGRVLEFVRVKEMTAWVMPAKSPKAIVPRWAGSKMALSTLLADRTRGLIAQARHGIYASPELRLVRPLLELQRRWSALPDEREWLIERIATRDGHYLFFYPFEGRLAHLGLATLFSYRLSRAVPRTFSLMVNDYGFGLLSRRTGGAFARRSRPPAGRAPRRSRHPRGTERRRNGTAPVSRTRARRGPRLPGLPGTVAVEPAAAGVERTALRRVRAIRSRQPAAGAVGAGGARAPPRRAAPRTRRWRACAAAARCCMQPARPTPFAFPLMVEMFREKLTTEALEARVARMVEALERAAESA